jgi:hypothetical protein
MYRCSGIPTIALVLVALFVVKPLGAKPSATDLRHKYKKLSSDFATANRDSRPKSPSSGSVLFVAPDEYSPTAQVGERAHDADNQYAQSLFELAKQAAETGETSLAFQWATEAVRENPDHAEARRVLGYEKRDGQWLTAYGAKMFDAGKTWHPKFGWITAADVPRYEKGERQVNGRWVSAAVDASRRADMKNGWQVRTDHFFVTTNHSLEAAAGLAARLERLYQVWRQLFAGFYLSDREVRALFTGDTRPRPAVRQFRVYYHRTRDEYNAALRSRQQRIDETLGIYFDTTHDAHFFAEDVTVGEPSTDASKRGHHDEMSTGGPPISTIYHEAVHQLFQESKPAAKRIGTIANAWAIEGVATYFETLNEHFDPRAGLYYTIGEWSEGRLPAASRRLKEKYYVPLAELVRLGKDGLQEPVDIAKRYSQACGLASFFIDSSDARYREAFTRYLQAVYAGRDNDQTLAEATGVGYPELDAAYRRYVESLP